MRHLLRSPLLYLLAGVACIQVATMPSMFYPGDNFAPRAEVADLLATGNWGIDYAYRENLGGFVAERGQYLYENDARQKFFSKYGVGYSLFYLPPLLAEKLYTGTIVPMQGTRSQMLFLNLYQVLITLIIAAYLYLLARLYTPRRWLCAVFVLAVFYGNFTWHYLRSPTLEIFQLLPFVGMFYHFVRFLRDRRDGTETRATWGHLLSASLWTGVLFLTKLSYGPLIPIMGLFAAFVGPRERSLRTRLGRAFSTDFWKLAMLLVLPLALTGIIFMAVNYYRCGSVFEDGYGQWYRNGKLQAQLDVRVVPRALRGLFLKPRNQWNVFVHYPLILVALGGVVRFARRRLVESVFLGVVVLATLLPVLCFHTWHGAWCYAPRYTLVVLMVGSLPSVAAAEWLLGLRSRFLGIGAMALIASMLLYSLHLQWYVNSLHYFTYYYLESMFGQFKIERIDNYFKQTYHRGLIHRDLLRYVKGQGEFLPMIEIERRIAPQYRHVLPQLDAQLKSLARPNFFFVPSLMKARGDS